MAETDMWHTCDRRVAEIWHSLFWLVGKYNSEQHPPSLIKSRGWSETRPNLCIIMTMTEFQLGFNSLGRRVEDKLCRCIDSVKFESESRFETSTYLGTVAIDGFHGTFYHGNWRALHHHAACWLVNIRITSPLVAIDAMESQKYYNQRDATDV